MLENHIKYSYNDVTIVPSEISEISHRSECNVLLENEKLPIFTAPMSTVINEDNFELFNMNSINTILPRNVELNTRIDFLKQKKWVALSLKEFIDLFNNEEKIRIWDECEKIFVLIDIANGHMKKLYDSVSKSKELFKNKLCIMVGNIANPDTYLYAYRAGVDYVRVGIGSGNGCFSKNTQISMADGSFKNIQDVIVGDNVKTLDGDKIVLSTKEIDSAKKIIINDDIECTLNHKFLVINKKDLNKITDKNLMEYAFYLEAEKLNENEHLLVKNV